MLPGETILSGASKTCMQCEVKVNFQVMQSGAGHYIGTQCRCGPYSRETHYMTYKDAVDALIYFNETGVMVGVR